MNPPAPRDDQHPPNPATGPAGVPDEIPGQWIGRYKILQKIGEGGCGAVYMAEQEQPVRRRVALKVIKLGMDTKEVIARFEAERQALALMDHPNIARVLDAGATDHGRPFFVMELVRGVPITTYCDESKLPAARRIELFAQVCHAIQHAHQKGIIHRDIKPSNILVALHDGLPVPKVIDFGIAKATQGRLTDATLFTVFDRFIGTPTYMSPEQASLSATDVDTRSDIYSLGVLLYELLTGCTPFNPQELAHAGMDEIRRQICEVEPARPSARLTTVQGEALATIARRRGIAPPRLAGSIHGDLDWIAMRCLEKDRTRRYATASDVADDLRHFLRDEPVSARPPSTWYVLRKLARRHRAATFWGSAFAAALLMGAGVITWQALDEAHNGRERAQLVARLPGKERDADAMLGLLREEFEDWLLPGHGPARDIAFRTVLDRAGVRIEAHAARAPESSFGLHDAFAAALLDLHDAAAAERFAIRAEELARKAWGKRDDRAFAALTQLSRVTLRLGKLPEAEAIEIRLLAVKRTRGVMSEEAAALADEGKLALADAFLRKAIEVRQRIFRDDPEQMLPATADYAYFLRNRGRLIEALPLFHRMAGWRTPAGGAPEYYGRRQIQLNLSEIYGEQGRWAEQIAVLANEVAIVRRERKPDLPVDELQQLAVALAKAGRTGEARERMEEILRDSNRSMNHPETFAAMAMAAYLQGNIAEAGERERELIRLSSEHTLPDGSPSKADPEFLHQACRAALERLASFHASFERRERELVVRTELLERMTRYHGPRNPVTFTAMGYLADAMLRMRRLAEAEELDLRLLALRREIPGKENWEILEVMDRLASTYQLRHKFTDAERMAREILDYGTKLGGPDAWFTRHAVSRLAEVLDLQGRNSEAEEIFTRALARRLDLDGPDERASLDAKNDLARFYARSGRFEAAEKLALEVWQGRARATGENHRGTLWAALHLAWIQAKCGRGTEAELLAARTLETQQRVWGNQHTSMAMETLALAQEAVGKPKEAEGTYRTAIALCRARPYWRRVHLPGHLFALGRNLLDRKEFAAAEPVLREGLALMGEFSPDDWYRFAAQSRLGASLTGQAKFAEAEPLLLSGAEGLRERHAFIAPFLRSVRREAVERLVQLYAAWESAAPNTGKAAQADRWRTALEELARTHPAVLPSAAKSL